MATKKPTEEAQLHVKLSSSDARKLSKLARGAKLSLSDAVRSMIRSTKTVVAAVARKD